MTNGRTAAAWTRALLLGLAVSAAGCGADDGFGEDFAFGAAVAGFQVDMGCPTLPASECEDPHSDWYRFVTSTVAIGRASNHLVGDAPSRGPGFYELYEEDLDRLVGMGLTHFRFSVEWSRVFPESTVGVEGHEALAARASSAGLAYYRRLLAAMKARGITPLVTLNHYTLPEWLHDAVGCNQDLARCERRGWLEPEAILEIAKYAGFVARELGGEVDRWATENEPLAIVIPGYLQPTEFRSNPPARTLALAEARAVMIALIRAHAGMYDAVKAADTQDADGDGRASEVGLVYNFAPVHPRNPDDRLDQRAARNVDRLLNGVFLDATVKGVLDDDLDGQGSPDPALAGRMDYLGVNYYTRVVVEGEEDSVFPAFSPLATFDPLTLEQGAVYAPGMYESLMALHERYPGVPLVVTENGADVGIFPDGERFLAEHLQYLRRAQDDGADVRGYYFWSLIDNYEWNLGMGPKFGLFAVDAADPRKPRTQRPVVDAYRRIATERVLPEDLRGRFPIEARP
jgi:beta-galactosidase